MKLKDEFDNAYEMLCEKLYLPGGYYYKDIEGMHDEARKILDELMDTKRYVDGKLKYVTKIIYKELKIDF